MIYNSDVPPMIADAMLGKLARYLRMLGIDIEYKSDYADDEIIKKALIENRWVLTRDTLLIKRREFARGKIKFIFINNDSVQEQLQQIFQYFKLERQLNFARCIVCNSELVKIDKKDVKDEVPEYVFLTQETFYKCNRCFKIYWSGTHVENMQKYFSELNIPDHGRSSGSG
ncbi:MAG: Mut7-C RNAse domain-containing protein [Actinobacteria bacterium]|nr:Mut7-C RNAse domain-containing protein [Actinomycetota bacterium]